MRFFNLIKYDFLKTSKSTWKNLIILLCLNLFFLMIFVCTMYNFHIHQVESVLNVKDLNYSFGDVLIYTYGGKMPYYGQERYELPIMWIALQAILCYFSLNFAKEDLYTSGIQIIVRVKSKASWLLSKIIWNVVTSSTFLAFIYFIFYIGSFVFLKSSDLDLNPALFKLCTGLELINQNTLIASLIMPLIVTITFNIMQMTLTLFVKPIYAYVVTMVYICLGCYFPYEFLIANFGIPVRNSTLGIYNFQSERGILICAFICISSFVIGVLKLGKINIVERND